MNPTYVGGVLKNQWKTQASNLSLFSNNFDTIRYGMQQEDQQSAETDSSSSTNPAEPLGFCI